MLELFANRFLRRGRDDIVDLATGIAVRIAVDDAGTRAQQQAWVMDCAAKLGGNAAGRSRLIDFGFVHARQRFEAYVAADRKAREWLVTPAGQRAVSAAVEQFDALPFSSFPGLLHLNTQEIDGCRLWLAREARLRGFIPIDCSSFRPIVLDRDRVAANDPLRLSIFGGRSIVVLDNHSPSHDIDRLPLCLLQLAEMRVRSVVAIVFVSDRIRDERLRFRRARSGDHAQAAEGHAEYGRPHASSTRRRAPLGFNSPSSNWIAESERWQNSGRHAAAERSLRAASAAFDRRNDLKRAGEASLRLGELLLSRGRACQAHEEFVRARERFQRLGAASAAVSAAVWCGLSETDDGRFDLADVTLRAAHIAATALSDASLTVSTAVALARNLLWQGQSDSAIAVLQQSPAPDSPRYWALLTRLQLQAGRVDAAWRCAVRARETLRQFPSSAASAYVRDVQAKVQARLGDLDALRLHVSAGLEASHAAHLPLYSVRLRLTLVEGLLDSGIHGEARAILRRIQRFRSESMPPILKKRIEHLGQLFAQESHDSVMPSGARETAPLFQTGQADAIPELLAVCHSADDEQEGLKAAAGIVKRYAHADVGIFGGDNTSPVPLGHAGNVTAIFARRCLEAGQPIAPEKTAAGVEAAVPIRHLGRTIGAIACRWPIEAPRIADDPLAFAKIAAAACAPLVQILLERSASKSLPAAPGGVEIVGVSSAIDEVRRQIARAANAPFGVLIEGETGTGKELVARAVHRAGCRRERPLAALNCAALTEELVDAELFGHARGAFTGALNERPGIFESAGGGTVFLDEAGELSPRAQAKLLRVLQEGEVRRVGENFTRPIDARLIAATNRSLRAEVDAGRFRQDLLYRLDVIRIAVPPLRERVEDIPMLATGFWRAAAERIGSRAVLGPATLAALARYDWPGNVRELQNVLAAMAVSAPNRGIVSPSALPSAVARATKTDAHETLDAARHRFEHRFVRAALARSSGHRGQTAAALGVSRQGLAKLMQRLQLP